MTDIRIVWREHPEGAKATEKKNVEYVDSTLHLTIYDSPTEWSKIPWAGILYCDFEEKH